MKLAGLRLRQRDGVTCGPTVAIVAGALLNPDTRARLLKPDGGEWFTGEQGRIHADLNKVWPLRLGTTPAGMTRALSGHSAKRGIGYRWRRFRGSRDGLSDVLAAVTEGLPVAMLIGGRGIPRHWVLIIDSSEDGATGTVLQCYEPSSGRVVPVALSAVRAARIAGLGFPRPFVFVVADRGS